MKTLLDLKIGEIGKVKKICIEGNLKKRVMDMGITKGIDILIYKSAPLGDPLYIQVRGYYLSIRRKDALKIEIE